MQKIVTFLLFTGQAEAAINFYTSLFADSQILSISRYGVEEAGPDGTVPLPGTVKHAAFTLHGQTFMAIDSNVQHEFGFTPAVSLYVNCETPDEIERLFQALSAGGQVFMSLDNYGFSQRFGWVADRFGVSWQLNLV